MLVLNPSKYRHWVDLDDPVEDGTPVVFEPARVKAAIEPLAPGSFDEERTSLQVTMRYHPQVTFNTRLRFTDRSGLAHQIFVRGIQNVQMLNRELVLFCEEVLTP